ncbi:MAG TPA: hypothetical protein VJ843_03250 [Candidatus Saccharimonadales bacterium]|nr:hypothetical protein [Candidatus Saccharimonadales bacterium]
MATPELTLLTDCQELGFAVPSDAEAFATLESKVERFQRAGAALVRLETDWDDTIGQGTWPIVRSAISNQAASGQKELYANHRASLQKGLLTHSQSWLWQVGALGTLVGQRIEPILEAAKADEGGVRDGARELYEHCKESGVPFIVKSASTRQVIEAASAAGGIKPDLVIATELLTDGKTPYSGTIVGWNFETMTHPLNKGDVRPAKLIALEQTHPHVIGLGDGTLDRMMIHPRNDTLWIRANGGYQHHSEEWDSYLAESFSQLHIFDEKNPEHYTTYPPYDLVSIEPDLVATNGLIRHLF